MRVFRCDGYYQEAMQQHSLLCYGEITNKRFKLYNVNIKYIRNLHNVDDNVPSVSPQIGKQARPFLDIVVLINGSKFCIPFTSNSGKKNKDFESMRENITFRKIRDKNGQILSYTLLAPQFLCQPHLRSLEFCDIAAGIQKPCQ